MKFAIKNLKTTAFVCATLVSAALFSGSASAADTPATIPSSFLGTYNLTYANAQPGSPLTNGTSVQVILGAGGTLCVAGYTLSNPVILDGNTAEAVWIESSAGLMLGLSNLNGSFNEINLATTSKTWLGQLKGSKTSTSTTGCGAVIPDPTQVNQLFSQAQKHFAQFFPTATASANQTLDGFTYRFYSTTQVYLAVKDGQVYVMGGTFGNTPSAQGSLQSLLSTLAGMDVEIPDVPNTGTATLVVTGTVGVLGVNTAINVTVENQAMPTANDVSDIRKAVEEAYKDSNISGDIQVTLVSSSASSIVFKIKFNGIIVAGGMNINQVYDLTYTYTK